MKRRMPFAGKCACMGVALATGLAAQGAGLPAAREGLRATRAIEDPSSGRRWVLSNDPAHPGGPGKLVEEPQGRAAKSRGEEKRMPVIRAGDRVLVEENGRMANGHFEAVALSAARQGERFRARIKAGGWVVWAIATGPARATVAGADEVGQ